MRKFFTLISMLALCVGVSAQTQTSLIEAYQIYPTAENGLQGSDAQIYLNMKNRNPINTWSCTLVLPEGIEFREASLVYDDGRFPADAYTPDFVVTPKNDGSISFACSGGEGEALTGQDGAVAVVTVYIPQTFKPDTYDIIVKDISLEEPGDATAGGAIHIYTNNGGQTVCPWIIEENAIQEATITFDLNGAPGVYMPITAPVGDAVDAPDDPEWEGHNFLGWEPSFPETMPEGGLTCVARWEIQKFNVYVEGEGVTVENAEPEYGSTVIICVEEYTDRALEALYVNQVDVKDQMQGNTYTINEVKSDIYVHALWRSTAATITISQEYTPYSCDYDLDFTGSDLKAYIASGFNKATNQAILVNVTDVPAYTGVLLIGKVGESYTIPQGQTSSYYVNLFKPFVEGGLLTPAGETSDAVPYINYIFAEVNGEPGFYSLEGLEDGVIPDATANGAILPANSAYMQLPRDFAESAVKIGFIFEDDVIDGINSIEATDNQTMFDLQGRRVNKAVKGIYIVNGKKIAVK